MAEEKDRGFLPAGTEDFSEGEGELCLIDLTANSDVSHIVFSEKMDAYDSEKSFQSSAVDSFYERSSLSVDIVEKNNQMLDTCRKRDSLGSPLVMDDFRAAVCKGNLEEVEAFLDKGVAVDTQLRASWTALMYAASCGHDKIVEFLLERGADANFNKASYMYTPLLAAASSVHRKDHVASCITVLLKKDADPNVHERSHMTPLMFVSKNGNMEAVYKLLEFGAQIDKQDNRGWTALCYAADQGLINIVDCLLNAGADAGKRCSEGTAGDIALNKGHIRVAELIDQKGGSSSGDSTSYHHKPLDLHSYSPSVRSSQHEDALLSKKANNATGDRSDDLDLFLCGLGLGHLLPCFHEQAIGFSTLLRMSEKDLIQIGINKYGWRQIILDALHEIHKRKWEPGSVRASSSTILSRLESIALLKNISNHVAYIGSSMTYVGNNWKTNCTLFDDKQDPGNLQRLVEETDEALKNTKQLFQELRNLKGQLKQAVCYDMSLPPDLILEAENLHKISRNWIFILAGAAMASFVILFKRTSIFDKVLQIIS